MIVASAVVTGFSAVIRDKLYSFMGHVHVAPYDPTNSNSFTPSPIYYDRRLEQQMQHLPHVLRVVPFAERPVIVQANNTMEGLRLKGVDGRYQLPADVDLSGKMINYTDSFYAHQILLSQSEANRLNVKVGDTVQLEFFVPGAMPRIRRVTVCGLYHSGMEEVDRTFGICDIRLLQRVNNWNADSINAYQLDLDNEYMADTTAAYIHYNLIAPSVEAYTTFENYSYLFDWLNLQRINSAVLIAIMAVVSIINMAAVLLMLMVNRSAMIGLLKALGMDFPHTRSIFLYIAGLIGIAGTVLGNVFALGLCWAQQRFGIIKLPEENYYMSHAPVKIVWWQIATIDGITLLLCVLCMWLPALYIRRIQPARVLQFK